MRDKLDLLRFKYYDINYTVKLQLERITDRAKYFTLSFFVVLWLVTCCFMFLQTYDYKVAEQSIESTQKFETAEEILEKVDLLAKIGSTAEAFDILATHRNHFADEYTKSQMKALEAKLIKMTEEANIADISVLYLTKDLVDQQPLYKFTGIVAEVDNDPLYGVTYTVSNDGERALEQLEVTGLDEVSVGSPVEFYGVPKFDSVTTPIKVEAYRVPIE